MVLVGLFNNTLIKNTDERVFSRRVYKYLLKEVIGALRNRADYIYSTLADAEDRQTESKKQKILKNILLRMVQVNEGEFTSRKVIHDPSGSSDVLNELDYVGDETDTIVEEVLDIMVESHLFSKG